MGNNEYLGYTNDKEMIQLEKERMEERTDKKFNKNDDLYGLALSGGGIRSASFSLGILQALAKHKALVKFDYLSTVSGGGYIGSSLSWFLNKEWKYEGNNKIIEFGVSDENFPFGTKPNTGDNEGPGSREKMSILRHLRQNINYLFPGGWIGPFALLSAVLRGIFINIVVYGPALVLVLSLLAYFLTLIPNISFLPGSGSALSGDAVAELSKLSMFLYLGGMLAMFNAVLLIMYGLACPLMEKKPDWMYKVHRVNLKVTGVIWILIISILIIGSLPFASKFLGDLMFGDKLMGGMSITIGGILSGVWGFIRTGSSQKSMIKIPTTLIITVSSILLIYGALLLAYGVLEHLLSSCDSIGDCYNNLLMSYFFIIPALTGFLVNVNYITLHGYYRDRLMELFMPSVKKDTIDLPAQPAEQANVCLLKDVYSKARCGNKNEVIIKAKGVVGPYHLINANIVLPGSKVTKFRGRGGDSFILSPLYCGSSATGWRRTDKFNNGKMTLSSAMAISGAAVNPSTGASGEGPTRNYFLSIIMSFLNLRLGVWVKNPAMPVSSVHFRPNLWRTGLYDSLMSFSLDENSAYIGLSDGGHFENLGAYELVRRKVKVIVICDGAADEDFKFSDFTNFVEKIRLDFGAIVKINLDVLIPRKGDDYAYCLPEMAIKGYATGEIKYNDGAVATLIYMKTTIVPDLSADIYGYKMKHDSFPDESTGDQVFDEKQFEAYRELGYQICKSMLLSNPEFVDKGGLLF